MPTATPIHLQLNHIRELFDEPAADPFDPDSRYNTGMDELWAQLHEIRPRDRDDVAITITLPADQIEPGLEAQTRLAIQRYSEAQMRANRSELAQIRLKAPRQLVYSILIVLLGTILGALILASELLPAVLNTVLASGLSIFAWVALWQPAQIYIYDWIPLVSDRRLYNLLQDLPLKITPRSRLPDQGCSDQGNCICPYGAHAIPLEEVFWNVPVGRQRQVKRV